MSQKSDNKVQSPDITDVVHLRHLLLFFFRETKTACEALAEISEVYGSSTIDLKTCEYWFKRFENGNFSLEEVDDGNVVEDETQ